MTGCSVFKKSETTESLAVNGQLSLMEQIRALNITNNDFNIQKAEIEITENIEGRKMIGTVKFKIPGTFLISIRNLTGFEAARIYITKDTILINDRINRKQYYGSPEYLLKKYGITTEVLPVLFGDYISEENQDKSLNCKNNFNISNEIINGRKITYSIDCGKKKVTEVRSIDKETGKGIIIQFGRFRRIGENILAGNIEIKDTGAETNIKISIKKFKEGIQGDVTFIPGKNYDHILLK